MNLSNYKEYISGTKFSNALLVKIDRSRLSNRLSLIRSLVKGKSVIHVGCVDHNPELIETKLKKDRWLHKIMDQSASRCLGVDTDSDGIGYLREKLGYSDLICGDIFDPIIREEICRQKWDFMVIGELLEHTTNPTEFLTRVATLYGKSVDQIIITVPNAFSLNNIINAFKNIEMINSDHYYWFTPYTLSRIVAQTKMNTKELHLCQYFDQVDLGLRYKILNPLKTISKTFKRLLLRRIPLIRECLVAVISNV